MQKHAGLCAPALNACVYSAYTHVCTGTYIKTAKRNAPKIARTKRPNLTSNQ
jgi:hypothetical protein